jgi:four helix bundle protein
MMDDEKKNKNALGYRNLDIYVLAKRLAVEIHAMTLRLPKHELYEEGSQIRRSSKSVVSNIVEGFGRRRYKSEFLYCITIANSECDETQAHLEMLFETKSFQDKEKYEWFKAEYNKLGRMLTSFFGSVSRQHVSEK